MGEVSAVVVSYNALPWIEPCLESVRELETVVVDHGSSDGTVAFVRERFPEVRLVEQENTAPNGVEAQANPHDDEGVIPSDQ